MGARGTCGCPSAVDTSIEYAADAEVAEAAEGGTITAPGRGVPPTRSAEMAVCEELRVRASDGRGATKLLWPLFVVPCAVAEAEAEEEVEAAEAEAEEVSCGADGGGGAAPAPPLSAAMAS